MNGKPDLIVVGGGLVGPALALALAGAGLRVTVLDRETAGRRADPGFDGRAYAIALASARLLGALGVWPEVEAKAEPIRDITVDEGIACATPLLHFDPRELDEGRVGWIVEDRWLRGALLTAMEAAEGITHLAPAEVAGSERGAAGASVRLAGGDTVEAPLIVACDGRRSALAAGAGIRRLRWDYGQTGLVNAIAHERTHAGVAHQSFFPGGPFAVLPLPGNRSSLVWSERTREAERLMALDDAAFTAEVAARVGPRLGRIELAGGRWAYPLDLSLAAAYAAPRLALAGDAAHGVHPIAGQGLNIGLRDVAALSEVLVEAARLGEDIGSEIVLERYQQWRRFDATVMALGMDALNRLFSNSHPVLRLARDAGLAAVGRMGGLRRLLMREAAGLEGDLPRLLRGQAL
ncbi:MAG TPA: UbiH/UbiF/VisC/COQ6 family ubiquinone biosynthesis hydroxylase [Thermohalobaculum sp.]|nr:UbiH/UbiF/VisC/COQ6 family ubiquinone biosynthesis hydroxylase [Thermohalobaculum sp.]